jgi:dephospho-CoA kinase
VVNAALLHRSVAFGELDFLILVTAPLLTRLLRARKRDRLPWGEIFRRFRSQRNFNSQYLSLNADIHIVNNRGCFPRFSRFEKKRLESRIDAILSVEGMRK